MQAVLPGLFAVATVDHGLRPESGAEAEGVGTLCAARGIPHEILRLDLSSGPGLQERARAARYDALGAWAAALGLGGIVTAHHADDQAETMVMRLSRGAGARGLAAMRPRSPLPGWPHIALLRPLLGWRRSELAQIVVAAGVDPVIDTSNGDPRFERARVRSFLRQMPDVDIMALAASAGHLAEADDAIEWAAGRCLGEATTLGKETLWAPHDTPRAIALRVLEKIVQRLAGTTPRGNALARWHDRLSAGRIATLAGIRGDGRKSTWRFTVTPPHRTGSATDSEHPKG